MDHNDQAVIIGKRIADARSRIGTTQAQFARDIHVTSTTLWRYERGQLTPGAEILGRIAQRADVSIDWIVTGEGRGPAASTPTAEVA